MNNCKKEKCPLQEKYYRISKTPEEAAMDAIIFGQSVLEIKYKKRIKDYEAYDTMHDNDGIVGKSNSTRKL